VEVFTPGEEDFLALNELAIDTELPVDGIDGDNSSTCPD